MKNLKTKLCIRNINNGDDVVNKHVMGNARIAITEQVWYGVYVLIDFQLIRVLIEKLDEKF